MKVIFKHPITGEIKEAPIGFSWTMLFFGSFVALFRGDWKWFAIIFFAAIITGGISGFFFPFFYNKLYVKELVYNGYKVKRVIGGDIEEAESRLGMSLEPLEQMEK